MNIRCPVCLNGHTQAKFSKQKYDFYKCNNCRTRFIHPPPAPEVLSDFYSDEEYHSRERYDVSRQEKKQNPVWNQRLDIIETMTAEKGPLLDVGCATGIFLKKANERGWNISGIEKSKNAAEIAASVIGTDRITTRDLLQITPKEKYKVITLWALIEHLAEPREYIAKINRFLEMDGVLALSTPNHNAISRFITRKKWRYYLPPEHLLYFNRYGLSRFLHESGFKVVVVKSHLKHIAFFPKDSFLIKLYTRHMILRIIFKAALFPLSIINKFMPVGETLEIYAQKVKDLETLSEKSKRY